MHTLENFVDVGADEDPSVFIDEVVSKVKCKRWLNNAREYAAQHTDTQRQADRLVQEIVFRDDRINEPWIEKELPLVEPRTNHYEIGHHRHAVSEKENTFEITRKIRAVINLNPDGTIKLGWLIDERYEVPKGFWKSFRGAVIMAGDFNDEPFTGGDSDESIFPTTT